MECERGMACFVQMPVWYIRHARLWFAETFLSFKRCKQRQTFYLFCLSGPAAVHLLTHGGMTLHHHLSHPPTPQTFV